MVTGGKRAQVIAAGVVTLIAGAGPAFAQRAGENAVAAAEDAFGTAIGTESIGLYSPTSARGFSPSDAGNVRIDGLYFDQQAAPNNRVISGSTVHVGISAQSYAFPAPTGIADLHLRVPSDVPVVSTVVNLGPYNSYGTEIDAQTPVVKDRLSIGLGGSIMRQDSDSGARHIEFMFGALAHFTPNDDTTINAFWGRRQDCNYGYQPTLFTAGPYLPPEYALHRYYGQEWAKGVCVESNFGATGRFDLGNDWMLRAGAFRSLKNNVKSYSELLRDIQPNGAGRYSIVGLPQQTFGSYSGEVRLSKIIPDGDLRHTFDVSLRGRDVRRNFGGTDVVDLGSNTVAIRKLVPYIDFNFGPKSHDQALQGTGGASYGLFWAGVGEINMGVQKTYYHREVQQPGLPLATSQANPVLYNASGNVFITPQLALYGSYTKGLEEAGTAPASAVNRGEAMPASLTQQVDAGLRYALTPRLSLVAGVFQVEKPYFNVNTSNVFGALGTVRHRGVELSVAGKLAEGLTIVGGTVLIEPRVSGDPVDRGVVGAVPVGPAPRFALVSLQYQVPAVKGLSLDGQVQNGSAQVARSDGRLYVPDWTQFNAGARYIFKMYNVPTSVRFQAFNITNAYSWTVSPNGSFSVKSPRNFRITIAADF
jgi:iron complex outermembrane receptor protein